MVVEVVEEVALHCLIMVVEVVEEVTVYSRCSVSSVSGVSGVSSVSRQDISCGAVDTVVESSISISCRLGLPLADGVDKGAVHTSSVRGVGGVGQSRVSSVSREAISCRVVDTLVVSSISISLGLSLPLANRVNKGVVHTGSVCIVGRVVQSKTGTHYRGVSTREVETIVEGVGISLGIRLS